MSSFWHAMDTREGDCSKGVNPKIKEQYELNLAALGYSQKQIAALMENFVEGVGGEGGESVRSLMANRGRIDGKPVNAYIYPMAVADPKLNPMDGKYAHGFNLDGVGATSTSLVDPETLETGVDHQLARVLGCIEPMRGKLKESTAFWLYWWVAIKDSTPAWTITISGDDLSKDGPITISFGRAMEAVIYNRDGSPRQAMTYRADPDPRVNNNTYKAQIRDGVITVTEHGKFRAINDQLLFPKMSLDNFHARLKILPNGLLEGIMGGYQPIEEIYFAMSSGNSTSEEGFGADWAGIYHLLRRLADAAPDENGQNWSISTAYFLQAAPAFVMQLNDADRRQALSR
ncbi:MAG: hypothetical protein AB7P20_20440 [Rhizobiaceae bacterium]